MQLERQFGGLWIYADNVRGISTGAPGAVNSCRIVRMLLKEGLNNSFSA